MYYNTCMIFFFFPSFFLSCISGERVELRVATAPWDSRVNAYIRLNPSPRNSRRGSAGGLTCLCVCMCVRVTSLFFFNAVHIPPVDLPSKFKNIFPAVMFAKTRLLVLSIVVASQVSWLVSVSRGKMFVHSRDISSKYIVTVFAQVPEFAILILFNIKNSICVCFI